MNKTFCHININPR